MRRVVRFALIALTIVSAVLCLTAATLWATSPWRSLLVAHNFGSTLVTAIAGDGWTRVGLERYSPGRGWADEVTITPARGTSYGTSIVRLMLASDGVGTRARRTPWGGRVAAPDWLLVLAFGILPAARTWASWRRQRRDRHAGGFPVEPSVPPQTNP